jgi:hypothetical protein
MTMSEDLEAAPDAHEGDLLAIVRFDYERSLEFIDGVTKISSTIRQTAATASVALIGLAIQDKSRALGIAAAVLGLVLGLMDGYHGALYSQTLKAVGAAERIFRQAKQALERPYDDAIRERLREMVEDYTPGVVSRLSTFSFGGLKEARPALMYLIYPVAIIGGAAAAYWR